jgi:hypothetical protein
MLDLSSEGFAIAAGVFDTGREAVAERLAQRKDLGVSHGFSYETKTMAGEILGYRTFEISPLPIERAANEFTGFLVGDKTQEVKAMSLTPEKKTFLLEQMDEGEVVALETALGRAKEHADEKGVEFKDVLAEVLDEKADDEKADETPPDAPGGEQVADATPTPSGEVPGLTEALQPVIDGFAALTARLDGQDKAIAELREVKASEPASEEKKAVTLADALAEAMKPKGQGIFIASESENNVIHGNDKDAKAVKAGLTGGTPEHITPQMDLLRSVVGRNTGPLMTVVDGSAEQNEGDAS